MRRAGELPYGWLADNTRWQRKPRTFTSVEQALEDTVEEPGLDGADIGRMMLDVRHDDRLVAFAPRKILTALRL
jgi:hypothetical protein